MLQGVQDFHKAGIQLPCASLTKNNPSPRADAKRGMKKIYEKFLKKGSSFLLDSIFANKQNSISKLPVMALIRPLTTRDNTPFVGLKFQFILLEELAFFVRFCSAGFFFFFLLFFLWK